MLRKIEPAWNEVLNQCAFKKFRKFGDDIEPMTGYPLANYLRNQFAQKHSEPWLTKLMYEEERVNRKGKALSYFEHPKYKEHYAAIEAKKV